MAFPAVDAGVVSVVWADASPMTLEEAESCVVRLPPDERERFRKYRHPLAASQFLVGRMLIRAWLQAVSGTAAAEWQIVEGARGRPAIAHPPSKWSFNLAHSGGLVACVLSLLPDVGVDLEHLDRRPMARDLYRRFCSPAEIADIERQPEEARARRFLTYWTLKEAYLKARGLGIAVSLADVEFAIDGPRPSISFRGSLEGTDRGWAFALFQPSPRCLLSVAAPQPLGSPSTPLRCASRASRSTDRNVMRLLAISDLHVSHPLNRDGVAAMGEYPDDWLIVAGDIGEQVTHLRFTLDHLTPRFAKVIWTPGNHDLWCPPDAADRTHGQARYDELVDICRGYGVLTPEDPFLAFPTSPTSPTSSTFICPLFLLYDYSFRPPEITREKAIPWARESGVVCGDELLLDAAPWPSRDAWCQARCDAAEQRLSELPPDAQTVLINHWPLRYDLARPPRVPRFSIWCGTTRTDDWPRRFRARAVVSGHLHMRTTLVRDGVRHEEVSLGYPRDWQQSRGVDWYLRDVLPEAEAPDSRFVPARDPFMMRQPG